MKALTKAVKQMLDALAHQHAGEHLSLKDKTAILGDELETLKNTGSSVFEASKVRSTSKARRVALYMGSELPAKVMEYVIDTCASLGQELTILTFQSEEAGEALLSPYQQALEKAGVDMEMVFLKGEQPIKGLSRYLRSHSEITFLACKDTGYLGRSYLKGTQKQDALPVPVVVVASSEEAASLQEQVESAEGTSKQDVA